MRFDRRKEGVEVAQSELKYTKQIEQIIRNLTRELDEKTRLHHVIKKQIQVYGEGKTGDQEFDRFRGAFNETLESFVSNMARIQNEIVALRELKDNIQKIERTMATNRQLRVQALEMLYPEQVFQEIVSKGLIDDPKIIVNGITEMLDRSNKDVLTGMLNREYFLQQLQNKLDRITPGSVTYNPEIKNGFGLVYCDLNGLKGVNDLLGHTEGDRLITSFVEILSREFRVKRLRRSDYVAIEHGTINEKRKYDFAGRTGGDEIALIIQCSEASLVEKLTLVRSSYEEYLLQLESTEKTGVKFRQDLSKPGSRYNEDLPHGGISFGYVFVTPPNSHSLDELIKLVDDLMYQDKGEQYSLIGKSMKSRL
jgi:GGDEF domain-containing protein